MEDKFITLVSAAYNKITKLCSFIFKAIFFEWKITFIPSLRNLLHL